HIKEFESVILRVAYPKGNSVKGKLNRAKNLRPSLKKRLKAEWERQIDGIIGGKKKETVRSKAKKVKQRGKKGLPLDGVLRHGQGIYAKYKGKNYNAVYYSKKGIRLNRKDYPTLTSAAKAIVDSRTVNGWRFWKCKDAKGDLVPVMKFRK
ncbi:MAG: hypothetical protein ACYS18_04450, partial [Planctomycetota bacterium]